MANLESIREALNSLEEMIIEVDVLTHAFMDIQGNQEANMLGVYSRHVWRVKDRFEEFSALFYREAFPILDDMSRAKKGML